MFKKDIILGVILIAYGIFYNLRLKSKTKNNNDSKNEKELGEMATDFKKTKGWVCIAGGIILIIFVYM